jgi:DNA helicase-2/ATP-dependent DNA helicase PcrA
MVEERNRQNQEDLLKEQEKVRQRENTTLDYVFNVGERVFHEKLGVGHIADVMTVGESIMYTIDFGKMGKKAMDASYAKLKKLFDFAK